MNLEKDGQLIEGDEKLLDLASEYYSEFFGPPIEYEIQMDPEIWDNVVENALLCRPLSENEIKETLWQMEKNKTDRPDKVPIEFYQWQHLPGSDLVVDVR